tara:strand:+ start:327 stop:560 length:234 start_codon:yes stop_codon:yes gene_type:complete
MSPLDELDALGPPAPRTPTFALWIAAAVLVTAYLAVPPALTAALRSAACALTIGGLLLGAVLLFVHAFDRLIVYLAN